MSLSPNPLAKLEGPLGAGKGRKGGEIKGKKWTEVMGENTPPRCKFLTTALMTSHNKQTNIDHCCKTSLKE